MYIVPQHLVRFSDGTSLNVSQKYWRYTTNYHDTLQRMLKLYVPLALNVYTCVRYMISDLK
jgi:hypothetical protein